MTRLVLEQAMASPVNLRRLRSPSPLSECKLIQNRIDTRILANYVIVSSSPSPSFSNSSWPGTTSARSVSVPRPQTDILMALVAVAAGSVGRTSETRNPALTMTSSLVTLHQVMSNLMEVRRTDMVPPVMDTGIPRTPATIKQLSFVVDMHD